MTPERYQRICELFDEALEHASGERAAFLAEACGADVALRAEVEKFLVGMEPAEDYLARPAMDVAAELLAQQQQNPSALGKQISHYQILSLLGAGGMGRVYLARDARLQRNIALKLLPTQYTQDAERVSRFRTEAQAASALNHPNLLTIYDVGQAEGTHFIATEYVEGQTLRQLLQTGALPPAQVVEIAVQMADALAAAHNAGILHRDIKPENVMLRPDGYVKVLDFGLAKLRREEGGGRKDESEKVTPIHPSALRPPPSTMPGKVMGTISYMSPEQALGQTVDRRTDIFSLGVVLYEMLSGTQPFAGPSDAAVYNAIINHSPKPLGETQPDTPLALAQIINRALAKNAAERYQTAEELRRDLQQLKQTTSASSAAFVAVTPPRRFAFLVRARWFVPLAAALVLAVSALVYFRFFRQVAQPLAAQNYNFTQFTTNGTSAAPSFAPDGKTVVFANAESGNWDLYFQRVGGTNALNLTKDSPAHDTQPALSPNGEWMAFRSERDGGGIFVMGATGENVRRVADTGYYPAWSPDSQAIVYCSDSFDDPNLRRNVPSSLWILNLASGTKRELTKGDAVQPAWSPHGHRIAFWGLDAGGNRDIKTIARDGGEPVTVTQDAALDWNPVWSRDGQYLYFASHRSGSMNFWRVPLDEKTGQPQGPPEPFTVPSGYSQDLAFSSDGKQLAFVQKTSSANIIQAEFNPDTATVAQTRTPLTQGARIDHSPGVSPDGEWIVFEATKDKQEDLFVMKRDGSNVRQLTNDLHKDRYGSWSPDGQRILFFSDRSGDYQSWVINFDGSGLAQHSFSPNELLSIWSPDGKQLVQSYFGAYPKIFAADKPLAEQTPFQISAYQEPKNWMIAYAWSPDGTKIAGTRMGTDKELSGVLVYDLSSPGYLKAPNFGAWPTWLNDNRRLLFFEPGKAFVYDIVSAQTKEILALPPTESFQSLTLSPDNRALYYSLNKKAANIWLASVE
ncbi:MAG: protein kinase domain-containing protein [Blastocatellia bacterium]